MCIGGPNRLVRRKAWYSDYGKSDNNFGVWICGIVTGESLLI